MERCCPQSNLSTKILISFTFKLSKHQSIHHRSCCSHASISRRRLQAYIPYRWMPIAAFLTLTSDFHYLPSAILGTEILIRSILCQLKQYSHQNLGYAPTPRISELTRPLIQDCRSRVDPLQGYNFHSPNSVEVLVLKANGVRTIETNDSYIIFHLIPSLYRY